MGCGCKSDQTPAQVWEFTEKEKMNIFDDKKSCFGNSNFFSAST